MYPSPVGTPSSLAPTTLVHVCRLAEGGMGRVDLAMRKAGGFRRLYAVKRLHLHLSSDPEFRAMFLDEARIAGLLQHPNVVGVLDVGEDQHGPFLVMDYVDGLPLGNLVRLSAVAAEPMPVQIAVRIAVGIARGLHAAHELTVDGRSLGLVHRDLSPQNVLIGFDGTVRIVDFGIAKALGRVTRTRTGVVKGKVGYIAPEQLRMQEPDRRSDLYSLGVVLYEMLAGARLYKDSVRRAGSAPPDIGEVRADVPDSLVQLLFELLAERADARPPDAQDVASRLEEALSELVAHEGVAEVGDYVQVVAGHVREEQSRAVEEAIEGAERAEAARGRRSRARSRARAALVALALFAVAGVGVAIALRAPDATGDSVPEPSPIAPEPASSEPAVHARTPGEPPAERAAPPTARVAVDPTAEVAPAEPDGAEPVSEDAAPTAGADDPGVERAREETRAERRARRRRAQARRRAAMQREEASAELPEWVEFGQ